MSSSSSSWVKPSENIDQVLSERARNTKSKETIKWLLERKTPLSSIFEADDDKYDKDAFGKALVEVMIDDRDNLPVQHVLNSDREDDWKLAVGGIKEIKGEDMKPRLDDLLSDLPSSQSDRKSFPDFALEDDMDMEFIKLVPDKVLAKAARHAQKAVEDDKDKAKLESLHALIIDLDQSMSCCPSIQAYLSVIVFLVWAAKDILGTRDPKRHRRLRDATELLFRSYVALVLLIESKVRTLTKPQIWLEIPAGEIDEVVRERLPPVAHFELMNNNYEKNLTGKSFRYLPDGTLADAGPFAKALAKAMLPDVTRPLKLSTHVSLEDPVMLVASMNYMDHDNLASEFRPNNDVVNRQREEGEYAISSLDREEFLSRRLVEEGWIKCINDRPGFVADDLLSRNSLQDESRELAKIIQERLETLPNVTDVKKVMDQDPHWHIFPLIQDLGAEIGRRDETVRIDKHVTRSLYLFWAAANALSTFPDDDLYKKSREITRATAERLLRHYVALVLIGEAELNPGEHKIPRKNVPGYDYHNGRWQRIIIKPPTTGQSKAEQSSTGAAGATESKTEVSKAEESKTQSDLELYVIPRRPVSSTSRILKCCGCVIL
ncbi:hypothetical protein B0T20DRAFT_360634 [Sordaria brevicollis]|uniref:Uncharacterized protein n=1 Tax=Sordaria brevicollis TaxID=83679 RepID=A0AAE0U648_SORBR|nr:hypothetical protein B0T20DRAFT_360634 [Sordaria brevicollis]